MEKVEGMIPPGTVAPKGTSKAEMLTYVKADIAGTAGEWADQPSRAGKNKAGAEGDLKHALRKICQSIGSTSWPEVKAAIKEKKVINELLGSATDPIRIRYFRFSMKRIAKGLVLTHYGQICYP